jgi:antitoxin component of MazEF toxin-antitoxin module
MADTFTMVIGAKRQVTFPARLLEILSLKEGNEIEISVDNGQISLVPMVKVPRHFVSPALLEKMEARSGVKQSDMSFDDFEAWLDSAKPAAAQTPSSADESVESRQKVRAPAGAKARAKVAG